MALSSTSKFLKIYFLCWVGLKVIGKLNSINSISKKIKKPL